MIVCQNANIYPEPCEGSVYSRRIDCKAGIGVKCLRNCSAGCPAYKPKQKKQTLPVSAYQSKSKSYADVDMKTRINPYTAKSSSSTCGSCGEH
jgi:hypothetical protein